MTQLSPAAQAVLNAINKELDEAPWDVSFLAGVSASAVLLAVADQVVPETPKPSGNSDWDVDHWILVLDSYYQRKNTRVQILAIATELKAL
jgi:hypothetical protein